MENSVQWQSFLATNPHAKEVFEELTVAQSAVKRLSAELSHLYHASNDQVAVQALGLSPKVTKKLTTHGLKTVADVLHLLDYGPDAVLAIRNFGEVSLAELIEKLTQFGYLSDDSRRDWLGWD